MKQSFVVLTFLTAFAFSTHAFATEGHHTLGAQAGEEILASDVGNNFNSALGFGAFFDYAASDWIEFELAWITSSHTAAGGASINGVSLGSPTLAVNSYMLGLQYDIDTYDIFTPYVRGGAEFASASMSLSPNSISTTTFGLDVAIGAKADIAANLMVGLDIMYHSMFTGTATIPGSSTSANVLESYTTVMLRFGFTFGQGGYHTKPLEKAGAPFVN